MIKLFEQFNNEQEIHDICKKYNIENYTINPDGSIDVVGNIDLSERNLKNIPLKFNKISGNFDCSINKLTTLEGCPKYVGGTFRCSHNKLTSLKGSPIIIEHDFYLSNNPISIIDSSIEVKITIRMSGTNFDDKIKNLSQDKLRILFEHGIDYDIFRKDGSINDSRLERMFKDFEV